MFEYVTRKVAGETGRFVELIWFARGRIAGVSERIAPTGSTVAAVVLGDPIRLTPGGGGVSLSAETGFLIGPHDRPVVNEPQGETYCVGIVTRPVGCRPSFGACTGCVPGAGRRPVRGLASCHRSAARALVVSLTCRGP